jgi:dihydroorotate dehydrogenase
MPDTSAGLYRRVLFPLLTLADAERSHNLALRALAAAGAVAPLLKTVLAVDDPRLRVRTMGLTFANPVGLCAGFDKDGIAVRGNAALGFSHVEVGTVTPQPQPGRPRPRLFRLKPDRALINRMGFPSHGAAAVVHHLRDLRRRDFVLGVNVGPNAGSVGVDDFVSAAFALSPHADYVTVNVSSPNTSGLRGMQRADALASLLGALDWLQAPLLVKIAPDLEDAELRDVLDAIMAHQVAGVIATNTTVDRPPSLHSSPAVAEAGGLSGEPLRRRATGVVRAIARHTGGRLPIVASGGIASAEHALEKLEAGASLVQIYTGFIYEGPLAVRRINLGLLRAVEERGLASVQDLVGTKV